MHIAFSMDGIKNMDQLYTWTVKQLEGLEIEGKARHYHGEDYCRRIVESLDGWKEKNYIGSIEQIAKEPLNKSIQHSPV